MAFFPVFLGALSNPIFRCLLVAVLLHDTSMADAQSNWRWCNKCQGLAYAGNSQGVCPAGGTHNIASDNYNVIDL